MKRRAFVASLAAAAALPRGVLAQPQAVVGVLLVSNPEPFAGLFKAALAKVGLVDGKSIRLEFRYAGGNMDRLPALATELVGLKPSLIVASQTPTVLALKQATTSIPIVMAPAGDPIRTGLISSYARPGGNITGLSSATTETGGKLVELARQIRPEAKRVAALANAADPFSKPFIEQIQSVGRKLAIETPAVSVRGAAELEKAYEQLVAMRADVVIVQPSLPRKTAADLSLRHRLPSLSPAGLYPVDGGLGSYSPNPDEFYREAATYVERILKGAKPGEMPVQQPFKFDLALNLRTAKALGITIPASVLTRADRVID